MGVEGTVEAYYDDLRAGEPLAPYFAEAETTVKFGISETLRGGGAVRAGLREQSQTTTDWTVESETLLVGEREGWGWFTDDVVLAWTDTEQRIRHEFDTRWSGTLEAGPDGWQFVEMHVSTAGEL
jgi:hypothetical protein